jgi:hypothetical protein
MTPRQRRRSRQRALKTTFWRANVNFLTDVVIATTLPPPEDKQFLDRKSATYLLTLLLLGAFALSEI